MNGKRVIKYIIFCFENMSTNMEFLAVEGVPDSVSILISELARLQKNLNLDEQFAEFKIGDKEVRVTLKPEMSSLHDDEENSTDEYFTMDSISLDDKVSSTDSSDEKETVVSLAKEWETDCKSQVYK